MSKCQAISVFRFALLITLSLPSPLSDRNPGSPGTSLRNLRRNLLEVKREPLLYFGAIEGKTRGECRGTRVPGVGFRVSGVGEELCQE